MKAFLLMMILAGCGTDESQLIPQASPTPTPAIPVETKTAATSPEQKTVETPVAQKTPTVIPTPTPTPTSPFQSHALIVQQGFETDEWRFNISQGYLMYSNLPDNLKFMNTPAIVYRKVGGVTYTCVFRVNVYIAENAPADSWSTIMLQAGPSVGINTSNQPAQCQASVLHYITFKISNQCQGYNQSTYICGQNTTYDLVE